MAINENYTPISASKYEAVHTERVDFDAIDTKGRRLGYRVNITRWDYTPMTPEELADRQWYSSVPSSWIGGIYEVRPTSTRNGLAFGAIPVRSIRYFKTLEEAKAEAAAMIERGRKSVSKKKGYVG